MKIPIKFRVTSRHIKKGIPEQSDSCPIYFALKETLRCSAFDEIEVQNHQINIGEISARHTKKTNNFIRAFDAGRKVKPFSDTIYLDI